MRAVRMSWAVAVSEEREVSSSDKKRSVVVDQN